MFSKESVGESTTGKQIMRTMKPTEKSRNRESQYGIGTESRINTQKFVKGGNTTGMSRDSSADSEGNILVNSPPLKTHGMISPMFATYVDTNFFDASRENIMTGNTTRLTETLEDLCNSKHDISPIQIKENYTEPRSFFNYEN